MTELRPETKPMEQPRRSDLRDWLAPVIPGSRLAGWLGPLLVTAFAAFLRFDRLGNPHSVVFDETYYAKDAYALLKFGYEHSTIESAHGEADKLFLGGHADQIWQGGGAFVAHPPFGKWMISIGELLFGATPFGWRFMPALIGTLSVLILARIARRMTRSTMLGCAAGLLLALDGLELVTSRTALLDIFVMFWILCAFGFLVIDRDQARARLAARVEASGGFGEGLGPFVMHWWRIAAGVCLGLAVATKWTGIFYIAAFGLMVVVWDWGARRAAGVQHPVLGTLVLETLPSFLFLVVISAVTYIASWSGWIFTSGGWGRGRIASNPLLRPFESMDNLWHYHREMWNFHTNLHAKHPYQSWPWDWPILRRPVAFFYTEPKSGCGAAKCSREILGIGTPAIWWAAVVALVMVLIVWFLQRDWRAGAILLGYGTGWLPWFWPAFNDRTMFLFYATPMLPFMVLAIVLMLGMIIGPAQVPGLRRVIGSAAAGAYLLVVLADFFFLYPVLGAKVIPYEDWHARMWLNSWI
ncbi:dolichyl-phosphate-mannose--protein mannosyltransferase [Actinomadura scrupuli]|uniref:dolichyl-phosphate-mannose--protein mannosyltransferase n=1 Tax=Actinomadura scrupuli TaxID=559629 RepID=UPI003D951E2D